MYLTQMIKQSNVYKNHHKFWYAIIKKQTVELLNGRRKNDNINKVDFFLLNK